MFSLDTFHASFSERPEVQDQHKALGKGSLASQQHRLPFKKHNLASSAEYMG